MQVTPHLLWAHYADSHDPYDVPPTALPVDVPPDMPRDYGNYLRCLTVVDREIARLLAGVARIHDMQRVAVLIMSDHGEGFGEHGIWRHAAGFFDAMVHVPAIFLGPGVPPAVHDGLTSQRDVAPTIHGAFGLSSDVEATEWAGRSWWRLRASPTAHLHTFVITYSNRLPTHSAGRTLQIIMVKGDHKLVVVPMDNEVQLFDLQADPTEGHNLLLEEPVLLAGMRAELELFRDLEDIFGWGVQLF